VSAVPTIRVGVDLVSVDEVAESVATFGDRYVTRIYTVHEIASCRRRSATDGGPDTLAFESLAARFAAKEAVMKVLRPVGVQLDWRTIELHRTTGGWCEIRLSGPAADLAAAAGIEELAVSVTHEASIAGAVVVGRCTNRGRSEP
jgi:holo-[acyl-carrier protein] synthase